MKKTIILITLFCITSLINLLNAQVAQYLWAKSAGGVGGEFAGDIAVDVSGNSYVTGRFNSSSITFGNTTLNNVSSVGYDDMFIVKYDANGNVVWAKSAGGNTTDYGSGITVDINGNIYLTGTYDSPSITIGNTTFLNPNFNNYIFIIKYDSNGNVVWAKSPSGIGNGISIVVDGTGNTYVTGAFYSSSITFGNITLTNGGSGNMFIVKYDTNGSVIWAKSAVGNSSGNEIDIDGSGNSYVTGSFTSSTIMFGSITLVNTTAGNGNMFIVKYDANGNAIWAKSSLGSYADAGLGIAVDGIGNAYVTGYFWSGSSVTFGSNTLINTASGSAMFIVKYDTNGSVIWAKSPSGSNDYGGQGIAVDANSNSYVTGWFMGSINFGGTTINNPTNPAAAYIVKYDINGNLVWVKSSTPGASGANIAVDLSENTYVFGQLVGSVSFGNNTLINNSGGYDDVFIAKLSKAISLQENCDFSYSINNMVVSFVKTNPNCTGFLWDFGNGNTSSINPNPIVTYATPGTYSPCFQCNTPVNCLSCVTIMVPGNGTGGTTNINEKQNNSNISIYPNPTMGVFKISSDIKINSIEIYNILGEKIFNQNYTNEINLSNYGKGIYFIKFYNGRNEYSQKIIVQ